MRDQEVHLRRRNVEQLGRPGDALRVLDVHRGAERGGGRGGRVHQDSGGQVAALGGRDGELRHGRRLQGIASGRSERETSLGGADVQERGNHMGCADGKRRDRQVGLSVTVEIARCRGESRAAGNHHFGLEGAIAHAYQGGQVVEAAAVGHDQVGLAIAAEIRHYDRRRREFGVHRDRRLEGSVAVAQQDSQLVLAAGAPGCHHQVELPVAVDISRRDENRVLRRGIVDGRLERSIAFTEKHGNTAGIGSRGTEGAAVGNCEVQFAIAVEIAGDQVHRVRAHGEVYRSLEAPVAATQQDADVVAAGVGHRQVQFAIAVEIARHHKFRGGSIYGEHDGRRERAVSVVQQDADVGHAVGEHQVRLAIAVEVARHQGIGFGGSQGNALGRLKCASALSQEHRKALAAGIGGHQVRFAVAIDIGNRHIGGSVCLVVLIPVEQSDGRSVEGPVALAKKYCHGRVVVPGRQSIRMSLGENQVRVAVAVEILHEETDKAARHGVIQRGRELSGPESKHNLDAGAVAGDGNIGNAVLIEVACAYLAISDVRWQHRARLEGAVPFAVQHRYARGAFEDQEIRLAIAGHIGSGQGTYVDRVTPGDRIGIARMKSPIRIGQKNFYGVVVIDDRQVGQAVSIEVVSRGHERVWPGGVIHRGLEGAVPVT